MVEPTGTVERARNEFFSQKHACISIRTAGGLTEETVASLTFTSREMWRSGQYQGNIIPSYPGDNSLFGCARRTRTWVDNSSRFRRYLNAERGYSSQICEIPC